MDDKINYDTRVYTDIQGLKKLQTNTDSPIVKKAVAQQFQSIMMQMVLSSMRDANKAFASDLFGSDQMDLYQDMFDKQLSMVLGNANIGFADMIEKSIDQQQAAVHPASANTTILNSPTTSNHSFAKNDLRIATLSIDDKRAAALSPTMTEKNANLLASSVPEDPEKESFNSPEEFVKNLWSTAKIAANSIGVGPEILLAQAALETNWGKSVLSNVSGGSSHNLFNIKAGINWHHKTALVDTLEQKNGVLVKEKSVFRSYHNFKESFIDYINLLKNDTRYQHALSKASDPAQFMSALQDAGYATDQDYADKVMRVLSSPLFQNAIAKVKDNI